MVLWDIMIGPYESPVLNNLPLWDLAEVLIERRRVDFNGNDDKYLKERRHYGRRSLKRGGGGG